MLQGPKPRALTRLFGSLGFVSLGMWKQEPSGKLLNLKHSLNLGLRFGVSGTEFGVKLWGFGLNTLRFWGFGLNTQFGVKVLGFRLEHSIWGKGLGFCTL